MFSCRRFSHNISIIHFCEVGVDLPAKPLSFVGPRQHGPDFLCLPAPLLAPCSPQSLCPSPSHANTVRIFSACRRPCWRLVPRKAFIFVGSRQHGPVFPGPPVPLLAPCSPQSLFPPSGHANTARIFTVCRCPCWRLVPRKPLFLRRGTPTWPGFPRSVGALVGALFPAKPLSFAEPRQHGPDSPGLPAPLLLQFPRKKKK